MRRKAAQVHSPLLGSGNAEPVYFDDGFSPQSHALQGSALHPSSGTKSEKQNRRRSRSEAGKIPPPQNFPRLRGAKAGALQPPPA